MAEIQKHYLNANGDHFVAVFKDQAAANAYTPPTGAVSVPTRPSPYHTWNGSEWVEGEAPAVPVDVQYPPLEQWRFWTVVDLNFGEGALLAAVDTLDDPLKTAARRILQFPPGGLFTRSNPLFSNSDLMAVLSIDEAGINALWVAGHNLALPG